MKTIFTIVILVLSSCSTVKFISKFDEYMSSKNKLEMEISILKCRMSKEKVHLPKYISYLRNYDELATRVNITILKIETQSSRGIWSRNSKNIEKKYSEDLHKYISSMDSLLTNLRNLEDKGGMLSLTEVPIVDAANTIIDITDKVNSSLNERRKRVTSKLYLEKLKDISSACSFE